MNIRAMTCTAASLTNRLGLLAVLIGLIGCGGLDSPPAPEPLDVVIISLDTVRRDHLSVYGYHRPTTPTLGRLADRAVVFDDAIAQHTNTAPSHASMLTGLYPTRHGVQRNGKPLVPAALSLAEVLQDAGYRTGAFVSGAPMGAQLSALDQGFDVYDDDFDDEGSSKGSDLRRDGADTVGRALEFLADDGPRPSFLFVHLYDAHGPYHPPAALDHQFADSEVPADCRQLEFIPAYQRLEGDDGEPIRRLCDYVGRYDRLLLHLDRQIDRLLSAVDLDNTVLVILADHGEILGERSWPLDHGASVFEAEIRIPWLLAAPSLAPGRRADTVETVDLLPTLLDLLGMPALADIDGRSLVGDTAEDRPSFASARADRERHPFPLDRQRDIHTLRQPPWKLIWYPGDDEDYWQLFHLGDDPNETRDLAADRPEIVDAKRRQLVRWWRSGQAAAITDAAAEPSSLDEETRRQLESLGYTGG